MKDFDRFFQKIYEQPLENRKDWYAPSTLDYAKYRAPYTEDIITFACDQLPANSDANLLELGSGPGNGTQHFVRRNYQITCVEPNTTACLFAKERFVDYPRIKIINSTFEEWESPEETYDAVIASTSFHWLNEETRYQQTAALLKPNGKMILLWATAPQPDPSVYRYLQPIYAEYLPIFADYDNLETQGKNINKIGDSLVESRYFEHLQCRQMIEEKTYLPEEYLALLTTLSPYITLTEARRQAFFTEMRTVFQAQNITEIFSQYVCAVHVATKV